MSSDLCEERIINNIKLISYQQLYCNTSYLMQLLRLAILLICRVSAFLTQYCGGNGLDLLSKLRNLVSSLNGATTWWDGSRHQQLGSVCLLGLCLKCSPHFLFTDAFNYYRMLREGILFCIFIYRFDFMIIVTNHSDTRPMYAFLSKCISISILENKIPTANRTEKSCWSCGGLPLLAGYSQSMSNPSNSYFLRKTITELMKVWRLAALATMAENLVGRWRTEFSLPCHMICTFVSN